MINQDIRRFYSLKLVVIQIRILLILFLFPSNLRARSSRGAVYETPALVERWVFGMDLTCEQSQAIFAQVARFIVIEKKIPMVHDMLQFPVHSLGDKSYIIAKCKLQCFHSRRPGKPITEKEERPFSCNSRSVGPMIFSGISRRVVIYLILSVARKTLFILFEHTVRILPEVNRVKCT